jgi:hypothetical protein
MSSYNPNAFYTDTSAFTRLQSSSLIRLNPIVIGTLADPVFPQECSIAIGQHAGYFNQASCAVAIGESAGRTFQGVDAIALGSEAGSENQGEEAIAVGAQAGQSGQAIHAIAVGSQAGQIEQASAAIAMGKLAGNTNQKIRTVAMGEEAGFLNQGTAAIAIGAFAGRNAQGSYSISIGHLAGYTNQHEKTIVLNAQGLGGASQLNTQGINRLYIAPIRPSSSVLPALRYDATDKEIVYETSSLRFKENVADLSLDTSALHQLRPREFDAKAEPGPRFYGFVAEEVHAAAPALAVLDHEQQPLSVNWNLITTYLVAEVKKLRAELDALKDLAATNQP